MLKTLSELNLEIHTDNKKADELLVWIKRKSLPYDMMANDSWHFPTGQDLVKALKQHFPWLIIKEPVQVYP